MKQKKIIPEFDESDESVPPSKPLRAEILAADEDFFVVSKPAGMFFDGGLFDDPSVAEQLAGGDEKLESELSAIYPIDPETSGVMLVSRTEAVQAALAEQLASRKLTVKFMALVRGMVMQEQGLIEAPLSNPRGGRVKVIPTGEPARTEWQLRDRFIGFALLDCFPRTAVEQQIRAHLFHVGIPLAVDAIHGGGEHLMLSSFKAGYRPSKRHPERPLIRRPSLHARSLTFDHPRTGERLEFEAPLPKDFKATLHQLDRFGRISK